MARSHNKDFLMAQPLAGLNSRVGTCPHGMPLGACPICNGTGGGGSSKPADTSRKIGEMTWSQCFAAGQLMKQTEAKVQASNVLLSEQLTRSITNYTNNIQQLISILKNTLPPSMSKTIDVLNQIIITPLLNILAKIPKIVESIQNGLENIRNTIQNVSEKLNAFFGEMKNFVNKKVSDFVKKATKKVFAFFSLTGMDEEEEIETEDFLEVFANKKEG